MVFIIAKLNSKQNIVRNFLHNTELEAPCPNLKWNEFISLHIQKSVSGQGIQVHVNIWMI